jgi:hypothetical protein
MKTDIVEAAFGKGNLTITPLKTDEAKKRKLKFRSNKNRPPFDAKATS